MIKLVGERYCKDTDVLTITTDRYTHLPHHSLNQTPKLGNKNSALRFPPSFYQLPFEKAEQELRHVPANRPLPRVLGELESCIFFFPPEILSSVFKT